MRGFIAATLFTAALAAPSYGSYGGEQPNYGSGYSTGGDDTPAVPSYPAAVPTPEVPVSSAAPSYPEETPEVPEVSSAVPTYPAETETPEASSAVPTYPAETVPAVPTAPGYGTPSETPEVPEASSTPVEIPETSAAPVPETSAAPVPTLPASSECTTQTTITVTLPSGTGAVPAPPAGTGYPVPPVGPSSPVAPYPISSANPVAPAPSGTGVVPQPPVGSGTGVPVVPTPTGGEYFTGAASLNNAAGFVAGLGAFAAFFL